MAVMLQMYHIMQPRAVRRQSMTIDGHGTAEMEYDFLQPHATFLFISTTMTRAVMDAVAQAARGAQLR